MLSYHSSNRASWLALFLASLPALFQGRADRDEEYNVKSLTREDQPPPSAYDARESARDCCANPLWAFCCCELSTDGARRPVMTISGSHISNLCLRTLLPAEDQGLAAWTAPPASSCH